MKNIFYSARDYLGQIQMADILIEQKLLELQDLMDSVRGATAINYDSDRVQTTPANSQEAIICKYVDLNDEVNRQIDDFVDMKHEIIDQIQSIGDSRYVQILFKVYVEYKTIRVVAEEMDLSYNYVSTLHSEALFAFERKYPEFFKNRN